MLSKKKKKTHRGTHTLEGTKKQEDTLVFFFSISLTNTPLVLSLIIFIYSDFIILFKV